MTEEKGKGAGAKPEDEVWQKNQMHEMNVNGIDTGGRRMPQ